MIANIREREDVTEYLKKRNLLLQYKKIKGYILNLENIFDKLKKRKPKKDGIYQFKINKQYRACCYFDENEKNTLIMFEINDH
ncbi:hypothetical protein KKG48_03630 [Patescibacteria group bacterium]|nr:hypothetical protein [Patescibacteria group bacterium]MCG2694704.1 hypothetical protein [Candidatus Parcubacteria bacterium]